MSLSNYAKEKALEFATNIYKQADPNANTETGSVIRGLFILPFSMIYAAVFQEIETLRNMHLGNYQSIGESEMDILGSNFLVTRPEGSRSTTNLRVYLSELKTFSLDTRAYFSSLKGASYSPIQPTTFHVNDIIEDDGEYYVNIPVISTSFGPSSSSKAGEITEWKNMPVKVSRVTNPSATEGGNPRATNTQFFHYIQDSINDGTPNQIGGIRNYVIDNYPETEDIKVVQAGNPLMMRDEVWTSDGVNPNLSREGRPFGAEIDMGTIDFDTFDGRGRAASAVFDDSMVGKRIWIENDIENFRLIRKVVDSQTVILSGPTIEGSHAAKMYEEGPHILNMADVYLYFPNIQVNSTVVDKRYYLSLSKDLGSSFDKIHYSIEDGYAYQSIPSTGTLVINEGTDIEQVVRVTGTGSDADGAYLSLDASYAVGPVSTGAPLSLYDMSEIVVGEDITDTPVLYVLQVEKLDPLSFELAEEVPRTAPGSYDPPGWYISNTDSAEVFSAREKKKIVIDEKRGKPSFMAISEQGLDVISTTSYNYGDDEVTSSMDRIQITGDWSNSEGREVLLTSRPYTLQAHTASLTGAAISGGAGTDEITVTGLNVEVDGYVGYRNDIEVVLKDASNVVLHTFRPGDAILYGDKVKAKNNLVFNASGVKVDVNFPRLDTSITTPINGYAWGEDDDGTLKLWKKDWKFMEVNGITSSYASPFIPAYEIESVILATDGSTYIEVTTQDGLPTIIDSSGVMMTQGIDASAESSEGDYARFPMRVVYVTHSAFQEMQSTMDDGDVQLLCKETLVRSFHPTLIDASISYKGNSTSDEVYQRFVDLIHEIAKDIEDSEEARLDISNIIAALDEEGLTDAIDTKFEVRVTNYLSDGEYEVRYLNPSEETKQELAVHTAVSIGDDRIRLKRLKTTANVPGRGKLFLGDNNPDAQEVIPYEGVIDHGDGTYTFIFRSGILSKYEHSIWEGVQVSKRDYDPELEFSERAIFIPSTNRPYVRQLIVIKE